MNLRTLRISSLLVVPLLLPGCFIQLDGELGGEIREHLKGACWGDDMIASEHVTIEEAVTAVVVDGGVGDIEVRTHAAPGAVVHADVFGDDDDGPTARVRMEGSVLHVDVDCGDSDCCAADLELTIPATATLEVGLGVGDVSVSDVAGTTQIDLEVGDIGLHAVAGDLQLDTGTGSIDGEDLRGAAARVDVGTGDVDLKWSASATLDSIAVDVGVGSVDLEVPAGSYDLRLDAGVGDVDTDGLRADGAAPGSILVDVGTGDISIDGR
ncbi:MAG: hypothetical protein AB1Z98_30835 [Nannocystaceae bacterium]